MRVSVCYTHLGYAERGTIETTVDVIPRDPSATYRCLYDAAFLYCLYTAIPMCVVELPAFAASLEVAQKNLLLMISALAGFPALDDLFLIHENVVPNAIGILGNIF